MARKSRKSTARQKINEESGMIRKISTGIYARLSVDQGDDDTIENQISLLRQYARTKPELDVVDVYADNGFSGTNFERPEFMRMIGDIKTGRISCIIVKDLSRFGRNFIETGYYIETILPGLNATLIAVNDDFDSSREQDRSNIAIPVKNMVNEFYAKDASRKVCAYVENSQRRGDFPIENSVYGYWVDKENNTYVINPEAAKIVQLIYLWKLSGIQTEDIARRLNFLKIWTPYEYKYRREYKKDPGTGYKWDSNKVNDILKRQTYVGDRVLGKRKMEAYKNRPKARKTKEHEWIVHKHTHAPIILREEFEEVKQYFKKRNAERDPGIPRRNAKKPSEENLFASKIYCKKCGKYFCLTFKKYPDGRPKEDGAMYICGNRLGLEGCRRKVYLDYMTVVVKRQIRTLAAVVTEKRKWIAQQEKEHHTQNPVWRCKSRIGTLEQKEDAVTEKISRLYEDFANKLVEEEDFRQLMICYQEERQGIIREEKEAKLELQKLLNVKKELDELADKLEQYTGDFTLDRKLLDMLVERIDFESERKLEIHFKCRDLYRDVLALADGMPERRE